MAGFRKGLLIRYMEDKCIMVISSIIIDLLITSLLELSRRLSWSAL